MPKKIYCETVCSRNKCINKTRTLTISLDILSWKGNILQNVSLFKELQGPNDFWRKKDLTSHNNEQIYWCQTQSGDA